MSLRDEKLTARLQHLAADFLARQGLAPAGSLVTVTGFTLSRNHRDGTVSLSVLPPEKGPLALANARRERLELEAYVLTHLKVGKIPRLDFALDTSGHVVK